MYSSPLALDPNPIVSLTMEADIIDGGGKGGLGILKTDQFYGAARLGLSYHMFSPIYPKKSRQKLVQNGSKKEVVAETVDSEFQGSLKERLDSFTVDTRWYPFNAEIYLHKVSTDRAKSYLVKLGSTGKTNRWLDEMEVYNHKDKGQEVFASYAFSKAAAKFLKKNNIKPKVLELNESDVALAIPAFKEEGLETRIVSVSHTPEKCGHKSYYRGTCELLLPEESMPLLKCGEENFFSTPLINFGKVMAHNSDKVACVSKTHADFTKNRIYPQYAGKTVGITNGIDTSWLSQHIQVLYDSYIPGWRLNPKHLEEKIDNVPDDKFIEALKLNRKDSYEALMKLEAENRVISNFDTVQNKPSPEKPTIKFIKRFVDYKNGDQVLKRVNSFPDATFVFSGPPVEMWGRNLLGNLEKTIETSNTPIAYVLNNNREKARKMVLDGIWINIPQPFRESSGTSFMKAGINGIPLVTTYEGSIRDIKVDDGTNAFIVKSDVSNLDEKIEEAIGAWKDNLVSGHAAKQTASSFSYYLMPRMIIDYESMLYD